MGEGTRGRKGRRYEEEVQVKNQLVGLDDDKWFGIFNILISSESMAGLYYMFKYCEIDD